MHTAASRCFRFLLKKRLLSDCTPSTFPWLAQQHWMATAPHCVLGQSPAARPLGVLRQACCPLTAPVHIGHLHAAPSVCASLATARTCCAPSTSYAEDVCRRPRHLSRSKQPCSLAGTSRTSRHARNPFRQPAASKSDAAAATSDITLDYIMEQLCWNNSVDEHEQHGEICVTGRGKHLGISVTWTLKWLASGAFCEEIQGKELQFRWGYNGDPHSTCWEMDSSGVSRSIHCDDHESVIVSNYVRTGTWLQPHIRGRFDLELVPGPAATAAAAAAAARLGSIQRGPPKTRTARRAAYAAASAAAAAVAQATNSLSDVATVPSRVHALLGLRDSGEGAVPGAPAGAVAAAAAAVAAAPPNAAKQRPAVAGPPAVPGGDVATILIRLKGGRLVSKVLVRLSDWRVLGLEQPLCGDVEAWEFGEWKEYVPGVLFPKAMIHKAVAGGNHAYLTDACAATPDVPLPSLYQLPATPLLPRDTIFLGDGAPAPVPIWRAYSGHFLVRPLINGVEAGYVVVDTGASGFVITPAAAQQLKMEAFGEMHAASIAGKIASRFIKARSWALGNLEIRSPVMMMMDLDGLVKGAPPGGGEVIGIVGYDVFRRAVVEVPRMVPSSSTRSSSNSTGAASRQLQEAGPSQAAAAAAATATPGIAAPYDSTLYTRWTDDGAQLSISDRLARASQLPAAAGGMLPCPALASASSSPSGSSSVGFGHAGAWRPQPAGQELVMVMHNPEAYADDDEWDWSPVVLIASLPHVPVSFCDPAGTVHEVLLLLDSGACGADIMLHARAQRELGLVGSGLTRAQQHYMRGVGGESREIVKLEVMDLPWLDLAGVRFAQIASLPHVPVSFCDPAGTVHEVLLLLDSGACGADIMLHARAQRELGLVGSGLTRAQQHYMRGVGGESREIVKLEVMDLPWLDLAGVRFAQATCMCASVNGLDISLYSAGIICGDLLARLDWALDYSGQRIGFRKGAMAVGPIAPEPSARGK